MLGYFEATLGAATLAGYHDKTSKRAGAATLAGAPVCAQKRVVGRLHGMEAASMADAVAVVAVRSVDK